MPKVSVIIPTYQHANFLSNAIDSVLAQIYTDHELIIIDDGSIDGTREICAAYGNKIRYIYQDNRGQAAARNIGILVANGEYIGFLDADDEWLPFKLELEVEFLDKHQPVGMVYSDYTYFGSRASRKKTGFDHIALVSGHVQKEIFLNDLIFPPSAVLIRKACFEKVGIFDESLVPSEDLDMWLRIAGVFEIDHLDIPVARYRLHDKNTHLNRQRMISAYVATQKKFLAANSHLFNKTDLDKMYRHHYEIYLNSGLSYLIDSRHPQMAREVFRDYRRMCGANPVVYMWWMISFLPLPVACALHWLWALQIKLFRPAVIFVRMIRQHLHSLLHN